MGPVGSPLLVAHRGAPYVLPENTIESCRYAVEQLGCRALEVDVCFSKDNTPFLWHDPNPNAPYALWREMGLRGDGVFAPKVPLPGSRWRRPVSSLALEEVRAHFSYHQLAHLHRKNITPNATECTIPTLAEFFDWMTHTPRLEHIFLDLKLPAGVPAEVPLSALYAALQSTSEALLHSRITLLSLDRNAIEALSEASRRKGYAFRLGYSLNLPRGALLHPTRYSAVALAKAFGLSAVTLGKASWHTPFLWRAFLKTLAAEKERLAEWRREDPSSVPQLFAWTVNRPARARRLMELGVSGIMSDRAPELRAKEMTGP